MRTLSAVVLLALAALLPADEPAPQKEVAAIARELALPPIPPGADFAVDKQTFPAAALKPYAADVPLEDVQKAPPGKYKLRTTVLKTFATVREAWAPPAAPPPPPPKGKKGPRPTPPVTGFLTTLRSPVSETVKTQVREYQVLPAVGIVKLEEVLRELEAVAGLRASEPKRWQAHYDYAVAETHTRLAFLHEYDLSLGQVLKEELPEPDKAKGNDGWRLVPATKMHSKKDVQKLAEQSRELFGKLAADHKDTPWAALAKRELDRPPGLKWEPTGGK
jgi:hypothetical protein